MKKNIILFIALLVWNANCIAQQLKFIPITPGLSVIESTVNDTLIIQQELIDKDILLKIKIEDVKKDVAVTLYDLQHNSARIDKEYKYSDQLPNNYSLSNSNNYEEVIKITIIGGAPIAQSVYAELDFKWPSAIEDDKELHKILVLKIIGKAQTSSSRASDEGKSFVKVKDESNYLKTEIVQYTDVTGIQNDKPNGLLQFQGFLKVPLIKHKYVNGNATGFQFFRSIVADVTLNRVDKSKEEIDYHYTTFLYQDNKANRNPAPWLATTDLWRYSNLQFGLRLVPLTLEFGNFRLQFQSGIKVIKNRPYSEDTVRSGIDSGKVKSDFRSVYSVVKYLELFARNNNANDIQVSFSTGVMWLNLMDSYYEQIDILQQNPFNKITALTTVSKVSRSKPMWYTSLRLGAGLGKEKVVSTFLRLSYMLQTGKYNKPLGPIVEGMPVAYEEKKFYNNFLQVHMGTTIALEKLFGKNEKKVDDGPVNSSTQ